MNKLEILAVIKQIQYKDWVFTIGQDQDRLYLQVGFQAPDNSGHSSIRQLQTGRKWLLSPHMTKSELVATALKAVLTAEEHEARELFRYRGQAVFGPHFDVDVLAMVAATHNPDVRDGIGGPMEAIELNA